MRKRISFFIFFFFILVFLSLVGVLTTSFSFPGNNIQTVSGQKKLQSVPRHREKTSDLLMRKLMQNIPRVDSALMAWHKNRHLNGAVLIALDSTILYEEYLGMANRHTRKKIHPNCSFQIASVSKVFTAVLILKLVEQGKVNPEDTLQVYFPDFPYHGITIRHLLSHQSGLPDYVYALLPKLRECAEPSNEKWYQLFISSGLKPLSQPGKKFHYCNTNYVLLACLIEKVSGIPYARFLRQEILDPLGMKNTFTYSESKTISTVCLPYTKRGKLQPEDQNDFILGDKGIFSNPRDLFRFSYALHSGQLISGEWYRQAVHPQVYEKENKGYGLGFRLKNPLDTVGKDVFHNGWWHGYRSAFHYYPYYGITIIMMSNELDRHVYYTPILKDLLLGDKENGSALSEEEL